MSRRNTWPKGSIGDKIHRVSTPDMRIWWWRTRLILKQATEVELAEFESQQLPSWLKYLCEERRRHG